MSELNYSKKQIQPLIDKYAINAETNTTFARIIQMFDGQPSYQLWGVKMVFGKTAKIEELEAIKQWITDNKSLVKQLTKNGNIICYSSHADVAQLREEMEGLSKISFVKSIISCFNTSQRKLLSEYIKPDSFNGITCNANKTFLTWFDLFLKFSRLSGSTKSKVITRMSPERDVARIKSLLECALKEKYCWNKEDLMSFVANNTNDCDVIFNDGNIVVLEVKSYKDSNTLCYGRTKWCITSSDSQWDNYVVSKNRKQYFFFDFAKPEPDELAHIAFTVSKTDGITNAHSNSDACLLNNGITYHGKQVNIQKALKDAGVGLGLFLPLKKNSSFKWNIKDFFKYVDKHNKTVFTAYNKNNRVIVNVMDNSIMASMLSHTYIKVNNMPINNSTKCYILFDFNLKDTDDNSTVLIYYVKDTYKIDTLNQVYNTYGANIKDEHYLSNIGISREEYLSKEKVDPSILLHKLIDEGDSEGACALIDKEPEIDVNFEFNDKRPIFSAIDKKMYKVVGKIIANKNFDCNVDDGFSESLLQNFLYTYYLDKTHTLEAKDEECVRELITLLIDSGKFDLNYVDWNEDTLINIACTNKNMAWLVEKLAKNPKIDVNHVNDIEWAALGNAIRKKNIDAIKALGQRPDLEIREKDRALAKKLNINLDEYIKPKKFAEVTEEAVSTSENVVTAVEEDVDKYNEIFKKVFGCK